jgi:hypothetical protein
MKKHFDYQLVEHYYRNRMEWEDGPGSLQNIVSDEHIRVIRTWDNRDEDFGNRLIQSGLSGLECDSDDGWEQYSYYLKRRPIAGGEWRLVGFVEAKPDSDHEY